MILLIFMIAHGVNDGFMWVIPPLLPAIREHFHLSYTETGALYTLYRVLGDVLQAPIAYLVYFTPAHTLMAGGLIWSSLGMILASFSLSYGMLAWIFAISGIGRATYHPLAATLLSRAYGRESLGRAIALHMSGSSVGHVVAPFMVGLLLPLYGWRIPIVVWSTLGLLSGFGLFSYLRKQKDHLSSVGKPLRWPFFSRPMAVYLLAVSFWGIAQAGLMTFLPLYLVDNRSFSQEKAAAIYGLMSLSGAVFRPFIGGLMDRMGSRKPVLVGGYILCGISIFGLTTSTFLWLMYFFILLLGTFGSGHSGLSDTLLIEMIPSSRREETLGFIFTIRMGIASFSPLIVGLFSERFSIATVFLILSVVPIFTALILSRAEERPID